MAASRTRKLVVEISGDTKGLAGAFNKAERATSGLDGKLGPLNSKIGALGGSLAKLGKVAAVGLGALAVGGVALGKGFVDAAIESQKVTKQTEAVLKSMGNQAGVTAENVANLSEKLSMQTGIDDELIQSAENILLTFGQVRNGVGKMNKVFDRATAAALDMSVALGTDMKSSAMLVGKALNDPIRGLTALRRSGIQFTDAQTKQIKAMVAANDVMGAQKIMLEELERQFGGSAAAQATAGEKLQVIWGNLQEKLGEKLLPVLNSVATWLADKLPAAIDAATPFLEAAANKIGDIAAAIKTFVQDRLQELGEWWDKNGPAITATLKDLAKEFEEHVLPVLRTFATFVKEKVIPVLVGIAVWVATNKPVLVGLAAIISGVLVAAFVAWAVAATQAAVATALATWPVLAMGVALGALAAALIYAAAKWNDVNSNVWKVRYALERVGQVMAPIIAVAYMVADGILAIAKAVGELIGKLLIVKPLLGLLGSISDPLNGTLDDKVRAAMGSGDIPGRNANGTSNWRGGLSWVGERGPELVSLPRGAQVFDAATSARMVGGGGGTMVIEIPVVLDGRAIGRSRTVIEGIEDVQHVRARNRAS